MKSFDVDIISYPAFYEYENKILSRDFCYCGSPAQLLKEIFKVKRNEVWGAIIRREIIGIDRFPLDVRIGEDIIFLCTVYKKCMKGIISDKGCYNYYNRIDSAMCEMKSSDQQLQIDKNIINHVHEALLDRKDVFIDFIELKELDRVDGAGMLQLNQPADVLYRRIFALQIGHRADQVAIVKTH